MKTPTKTTKTAQPQKPVMGHAFGNARPDLTKGYGYPANMPMEGPKGAHAMAAHNRKNCK